MNFIKRLVKILFYLSIFVIALNYAPNIDYPSFSIDSGKLGKLKLLNQNNKVIGKNDIMGHSSIISFGFTNCPDACPITLSKIYINTKDKNFEKVKIYFVTLDPQRDTPDILKNYLGNFDEKIIGLTGSEENIRYLADALNVKYVKRKINSKNYTIDHTLTVFLMDKNFNKIGEIYYKDSKDAITKKLKLLL